MNTQNKYTYFKRYSRYSVGGVMTCISKTTAKILITRFAGNLKNEYRLPSETRVIELNNNNQILLSN